MKHTRVPALLLLILLGAWFGLACAALSHDCPDDHHEDGREHGGDLARCDFFGHCLQIHVGTTGIGLPSALVSGAPSFECAGPCLDLTIPNLSAGVSAQSQRAPPA